MLDLREKLGWILVMLVRVTKSHLCFFLERVQEKLVELGRIGIGDFWQPYIHANST